MKEDKFIHCVTACLIWDPRAKLLHQFLHRSKINVIVARIYLDDLDLMDHNIQPAAVRSAVGGLQSTILITINGNKWGALLPIAPVLM